jgi:hypothetical protein
MRFLSRFPLFQMRGPSGADTDREFFERDAQLHRQLDQIDQFECGPQSIARTADRNRPLGRLERPFFEGKQVELFAHTVGTLLGATRFGRVWKSVNLPGSLDAERFQLISPLLLVQTPVFTIFLDQLESESDLVVGESSSTHADVPDRR